MNKNPFLLLTGVNCSIDKFLFLMKLSLSLYLFMAVQLLANTVSSQDRITIDFEKTSLSSIISFIEKQTPYRFIYNNDEIDDGTKFDIKGQNKQIHIVLGELFNTSDISYEIRKKHIVLSRPPAQSNHAQENYTISGTVRDADTGETLLGATIAVAGTSKGVVTNEYGFYSITLSSGSYKLNVSYIGYQQKEFPIELDKKTKNWPLN